MAEIVTGISDISLELDKIYLNRISEYYGIGKPKPIISKDRGRIWLKLNEAMLEEIYKCDSDVSLIYPTKQS